MESGFQLGKGVGDLAFSKQKKIKLIHSLYVSYPRLTSILKKIADCHKASKYSQEPLCLFLTGDTGTGKSTLIQQYLKKYPKESAKPNTIPVLSSEIPARASIKGLAASLLAEMGDVFPAYGTTIDQTLRLYKLIKDNKVELIILDEFQHLIDQRSSRVLIQVADWLKMLINQAGIPIILIGMPQSENILSLNPQLKRRFLGMRRLTPFQWADPSSQKEFRLFLGTVDKALPFPKRSQFADSSIAYRIFIASGGIIAYVMNLIRGAAERSVDIGKSYVDLNSLAWAYDEYLGASNSFPKNPFAITIHDLTRTAIKHSPQFETNSPENIVGLSGRLRPKARKETASEVLHS